MKTFLDLVKTRYSVRSYESRAVEREKIERCLEAARLAPSACNSQPWHFIVADDPELVKSLAPRTRLTMSKMNSFVDQVPVITAVIGENPNLSAKLGSIMKNKPLYLLDLGIAAEHFCFQAVEEGLGSCILGWYNERAVKKLLKVPRRKRIYLLITLGYPSDNKVPNKVRKSFKEIVSWNRYES